MSESSSEKNDARKQLLEMMGHRSHVDNSVELIGNLLFGSSDGPMVLKTVRAAGEPLVDDWSCLKSTVRLYLTLVGISYLMFLFLFCYCSWAHCLGQRKFY